jgi:hypothetical protein
MKRSLSFSVLRIMGVSLCLLLFAHACGNTSPAPPCPEGVIGCWYLVTQFYDSSNNEGGPEPYVTVDGAWVPPDVPGAQGDESPFQQETDSVGKATILRRAPATW